MNHRRCLVPLSVSAVLSALPLIACGSYDDKENSAASSTSAAATNTDGGATTGQTATVGSTSTGGTSSTATATASTAGNSQATSSGAGGMTSTSTDSSTSTTGSVDASCDNVTACGGDAVGTWSVAGSCLPVSGEADLMGFGLGCPTAPVTGSLEVTGMLTFNDDGTFSDDTITTGDLVFELPETCLNVSGTVTTCDRVGSPVQSSLGFETVTCTENDSGGCDCPATINQAGGLAFTALGAPSSGSYTIADNVITMGTTEYTYCVEENMLSMSLQSTPKPGPVMGTVALQKQ